MMVDGRNEVVLQMALAALIGRLFVESHGAAEPDGVDDGYCGKSVFHTA